MKDLVAVIAVCAAILVGFVVYDHWRVYQLKERIHAYEAERARPRTAAEIETTNCLYHLNSEVRKDTAEYRAKFDACWPPVTR
jgi:hypothetical protein